MSGGKGKEKTTQILALGVCLAVCYGVAALGAIATRSSVGDWYLQLNKPPWNPPAWVFGPVWTLLYSLMALAAWLVWRRGGSAARTALVLFAVQLALNGAWSPIFFALRMPGLAFAVLVLLWIALVATVVAFWRARPLAASLMIPYLGWASFALVLNLTIWRMNA